MRDPSSSSRCPKCDSRDVIKDGAVFDTNRGASASLQAGFLAKPGALVFKGKTHNAVRARLCGSCGFVELFVEDPKDLFAEYQKARSRGA